MIDPKHGLWVRRNRQALNLITRPGRRLVCFEDIEINQ